jgi:hypothetical protein
MSKTSRLWQYALVPAGALALGVAVLAGPAMGDPPGNNGTIKVDGAPDSSGNANEPHVGCDFRIKFAHFDDGQTADIAIVGQAPSGSGTVNTRKDVLVGGDNAYTRYTMDDLDLSGLTAHPKQGYHLKINLTTDTPGGVKHKVFWLNCPQASPSPTVVPTETASETPSATVSATETATASESATPTESASVLPTELTQSPSETSSESVSPTVTASVLGVKIVKSAGGQPGTSVLGTGLTRPLGLPFTGAAALAALTAIAAGALAVGGALMAAARRRARHLA